MLLRLRRLPDEAHRLAAAAAVLGEGADPLTVADLAGLTRAQASTSATSLTEAEILQPGPAITFVHPLVGAAVYNDLPLVERTAHHERAALLLISGSRPAEQIAAHLELAPGRGDPQVVDLLRRAPPARRCAKARLTPRFASSPGRSPSRRRRTQRVEVLLELGRAESMVNGPAAAEHLAEAHALLEDPESRAATAQLLARTLVMTGYPAAGAAIARSAAAELPPELDDARLALVAFEFLAVLFGGGERESLRRLAEHRTPPAGPASAPRCWRRSPHKHGSMKAGRPMLAASSRSPPWPAAS